MCYIDVPGNMVTDAIAMDKIRLACNDITLECVRISCLDCGQQVLPKMFRSTINVSRSRCCQECLCGAQKCRKTFSDHRKRLNW